jgi:hypothetical protein
MTVPRKGAFPPRGSESPNKLSVNSIAIKPTGLPLITREHEMYGIEAVQLGVRNLFTLRGRTQRKFLSRLRRF